MVPHTSFEGRLVTFILKKEGRIKKGTCGYSISLMLGKLQLHSLYVVDKVLRVRLLDT